MRSLFVTATILISFLQHFLASAGAKATGNHLPPQRNAGVDDVTVFESTYFEQEIEKNAFLDEKDGNTRFLFLTLLDTSSGTNDTWLVLDPKKQLLFGVSPVDKKSSQQKSFSYLVKAENRQKLSITDEFNVQLNPKPRPTNHKIILIVSKYNRQLERNKLISSFAQLLAYALNLRWSSLKAPGTITFYKVNFIKSKLILVFFDNSLGSKLKCDQLAIGQMSQKMIGQSFVNITDQRVSPNKDFKNKFLPGFDISSIKILLTGPCKDEEKKMNEKAPVLLSTQPSTSLPSTAANVITVSETTTTSLLPSTTFSKTYPPEKKDFSTTLTTSTLATSTLATSTSTTSTSTTSTSTTSTSTTSTSTTSTSTTSTSTTSTSTTSTLATSKSTTSLPFFKFKEKFVMSVTVNKLTVIPANKLSVQSGSSPDSRITSFRLESENGNSPQWISFDSENGNFIALLMLRHVSNLRTFNSSHKIWEGKAYVYRNGKLKPLTAIPTSIYIANPSPRKANHLINLTVKNYYIANFTLEGFYRVLQVTNELVGGSSLEEISFKSIQQGSVKISLFYDKLADLSICPRSKINQLRDIFLTENGQIRPQVIERFRVEGYDISFIDVIFINSCAMKPFKPAPPSSTPIAPSSGFTLTNTTKNDKPNKPLQVAGQNPTGIIIGVTIVVCIVILILVIAVKFRSRKRALKKRRDAGTGLLANDVQPEDFTEQTLKPNHPVVFHGEDENLLNSQNPKPVLEQMRPLDNVNGNNKHLLVADERPPPPPYNTSSS